MKEKTSLIGDTLWRICLVAFAISIIVPLLWLFYESLKTNREFFRDIWALPEVLQWKNYAKAWETFKFGQVFFNTLYYVGGSLLLGTFLTAINAFALTRIQFKGRAFIWSTIMLSLFLPGINALVPQYVLMRDLHLTNSLTGLIILDSLGESVFFLLLLSGFMQSLPKELEEGAFVDGASLFQVFWKIIMPLSMAGIVTVGIFKFIGLYNNFLGPFIYLGDESKYTMAVNMFFANARMQYSSDWVTLFAGVVISMLPPVILYILFQRKVMEGATLGAVKG
ncbi:carbohydrate ABC transporter permease [Paenibacillus eucommiae]|uniref:Raffinose/stachyose/melibiose transport system permease protein/N-acetylglucosamine transport system permease protein n=1 Tax=Paenibacillus eucommiae TaxID=1355755 RepID=A0ABS4ILX3_9BACL|nr:carbohydrate ABC transporter permease [Paenibacillus eucommiae]MBP1988534.1 raffinose/stachyose/melibiose transport system permease protein/N-acetylglucosamine transport system permease protein [Paenibacillus eucommiae]